MSYNPNFDYAKAMQDYLNGGGAEKDPYYQILKQKREEKVANATPQQKNDWGIATENGRVTNAQDVLDPNWRTTPVNGKDPYDVPGGGMFAGDSVNYVPQNEPTLDTEGYINELTEAARTETTYHHHPNLVPDNNDEEIL